MPRRRSSSKDSKRTSREPLTIKTPADVLSFVGHTLGFWPQESLVCITLDANRVGATLRVISPPEILTKSHHAGYRQTCSKELCAPSLSNHTHIARMWQGRVGNLSTSRGSPASRRISS
nr:DUF4192 family protein [Arthrobacter oryzae]